MTQGHRGALTLRCRALSSPSPCRFIPALSKTPEIKAWLLRHPRFHLHFIPTSSSWLNLVERWFGEVTTRKIRRGTHRSVAELEADIYNWIEHWNANPRPFVWVKTAEQILESIAAYCQRLIPSINNSPH
jgi:DDE superfamily endonuclease